MSSPPEYACKYCGRSFMKRYNLLNHVKNIHIQTTCLCDICEEKLTSPAALSKHLARGHNRLRQGNPECDLCGKIFSRRAGIISHLLITHLTGAKPSTFKCKECNKKFTVKKNLKAHVRKIHKANFEYPACDECNKVFRGKKHLLAHIQEVHQLSANNMLRCRLCEKVYTLRSNLQRHVLACHGVNDDQHTCSVCSNTFSSNNELRRHAKTAHDVDIPQEFACEHCSKVFTEQAFLESHVLLHHDSSRPHNNSCECGKAFDSEPALRQHLRCDHDVDIYDSYCRNYHIRKASLEAPKDFIPGASHDCEICQEHFESLNDLWQHMSAAHTVHPALETCTACFAQFFSKEAIMEHQVVCRVPNQVLRCNQCDKIFTTKSKLNSHMKSLHPPKTTPSLASKEELEVEAPSELNCKYCDKPFKTKFMVQQHIEHAHLGVQRFQCLDCESHFKEKRNLRKHIRIKHTHSLTFPQCHFCQKRFESAKACKMHLNQVHSFETFTFPCELCSATCSTTDSLTLHMKTKHSDQEDLFKCESCLILFKGYDTFQKHSEKCQENAASVSESVPRCVVCVKDFCTEKSLKRHIRLFHKGLDPEQLIAIGFSRRSFAVDCEECLKNFKDREIYKIYLKNKKMSDAIVFRCSMCGDTYNVVEFAVQRYKKTGKVRRRKRRSDASDEEAGCSGGPSGQ